MVVIVVISVLLALALPALRGARNAGESITCLSRLHGLGQGAALVAESNGGYWLNSFWRDLHAGSVWYSAGAMSFQLLGYYNQVRAWPGAMIGVFWEEGDPAEVWTCPAVAKHGYGLASGPGQLRTQPFDGATMSYYYSAALISDPKLWDPAHPERLDNPDAYRRRVGVHDVRSPARKAALAEYADYHGRRILIADEPGVESLNTLFCDGHAARVRIADTTPPLATRRMFDYDPDDDRVPFLGTPFGSEGDDLAGRP